MSLQLFCFELLHSPISLENNINAPAGNASQAKIGNISSIKHDLARSCFQFWPKIGVEGDKSALPVFFSKFVNDSDFTSKVYLLYNILPLLSKS